MKDLRDIPEVDRLVELKTFLIDFVMPEDGEDNIIEEWKNATKMREWFNKYKKELIEDIEARVTKEAVAENWSESAKQSRINENEDRSRKNKIDEIVKKAGFLVMMQTP